MKALTLVTYTSDLQPYFEAINKEWVEKYFELEPFDIRQLENPQEHILDKGGAIIFAKEGDNILGTVGITPQGDGVFEMVKMGVKPEAQGKKVGLFLGEAILDIARQMGGKKVILYSSTKLEKALNLYRKLGFREMVPECGVYARCDIKMEIDL
ncbi:GNAT family N-acetyltransferase [Pararhodonellum marinum]|uniref:GNAT family N-acetyltransferase n=1 Tax=Pararhodonellum marinum TaxID=2755358 RepID=UPI00188E844B|nr:GNAT family N-acetyltransferase [Pararhodonellum marinum]